MKKLLKLLNEFGKPSPRGKKREKLDLECAERFYAVSKYFGFIKWLIENDKIDHIKITTLGTDDMQECYLEEEVLLMTLSIQDNPIEFLISILK